VAISGSGRSLENLLKFQHKSRFQIVCVVSSNPHCRGNEIANEHKLPLFVESFKNPNDANFAFNLRHKLTSNNVDLVVLVGFLKPWPILEGIDAINIHPALLPKFGGKGMYGSRVHEQVLASGESKSGATVHVVTDQYDQGSIIAQKSCSIAGLESADEIAHRVFTLECELLPATINHIAREGGLANALAKGIRYDV